MKLFAAIEGLLAYLPRTALLLLAVLAMRNPFAEHSLDNLGWYFKWPIQFGALLLLALTLAAGVRLALTRGPEGPGARPLA